MLEAVGIDPGDTSGVAVVNAETGELLQALQLDVEEYQEWLKKYLAKKDKPVAIIIEDFRLFRGRGDGQTGSRFWASQIIAITKMAARMAEVPVVLQEVNKKITGAKFSQVPPPANHAHSHMFDAYNHVFYWLVTRRGVKTSAQRSVAKVQADSGTAKSD